MVTAKLLVPAGGALQLSAGDRLAPLQPKPCSTWRSVSLPSITDGLFTENSSAQANPATSAAMAKAKIDKDTFTTTTRSLQFFCSHSDWIELAKILRYSQYS